MTVLKTTLKQAGASVAGLLQQHPKRITAAIAAVLLGCGGGAFAVVSLAPDADTLPVSQISEPVSPLPLAEQISALEVHRFNLYRSTTTRSSDTANALFKRLGIQDAQAASYIVNSPELRQALLSKGGRSVTAQANDQQELVSLTTRWIDSDSDSRFHRIVVERTGAGGLSTRSETAPLTSGTRIAGGTIYSSLFAATDAAQMPDAVATQIAEIFSGDIDFHRKLRRGDRFSVVYETLEADGEPLRAGRVLSAEFVNNGKTYTAMWFKENASHKGEYYTLDGQSLRHAYLASPMEFSRQTSGFGMRVHPIFGNWKMHNGVDYAAPTGTPVRTIGDGQVKFAGWQNGYGNTVVVQYRNEHEAKYAHLSRIDVRMGQSIAQGQRIGAVGATGWATGPHLHFEFRVKGQLQDPVEVVEENLTIPISPAARAGFDKTSAQHRTMLAAATSLQKSTAQ